ncbi:MAG: helix-turn-helix domain-containing protein [Cyclobacteriaceae bacterium]
MPLRDNGNKNLEIADAFVRYTSTHLFLTGKAGTGKTTFLKRMVSTCKKNIMIAAPTGVAAINAGGVTLHSLFQLPMGPFLPIDHAQSDHVNTKNSLYKKLKINRDKRKLINELELLIIDEISMVRADMLDAIDAVLRYIRKQPQKPFGGVQLLMIGDLYQLPPVTKDDDWRILNSYYPSPFFFHAKGLASTNFISIELQKIYRQSDDRFISILNGIRNNNLSAHQLESLNEHFDASLNSTKKDGYITLTTHNQKAFQINQNKLNSLSGDKFSYKASVSGDFQERSFPVDEVIELKVGAQVIFTKNDKEEPKRYYNGKLAIVSALDGHSISVRLSGSEEEINVDIEEWKNIKYKLNEEKNEIEEEELGIFSQYPLKLAWAITIHKSQGLTFERAIIDAQSSFSSGQVYVALSRLTSLDGLILRSKIHESSIRTSNEVVAFMEALPSYDHLLPYLEKSSNSYLTGQLVATYDFQPFLDSIHDYLDELGTGNATFKNEFEEHAKAWLIKGNELQIVGRKFQNQIYQYVEYNQIDELSLRISKGEDYFSEQIKTLQDEISKEKNSLGQKKGVKKYQTALYSIEVTLAHLFGGQSHAMVIVKGLKDSKKTMDILTELDEIRLSDKAEIAQKVKEIKPKKISRGETKFISLALFKEGKNIEAIAEERGLVPGTIESHLCNFIETGEVKVTDIVDPEKLKNILTVIKELNTEEPSSADIKSKLGDDYSYGEIKATLLFTKFEKVKLAAGQADKTSTE